VTESPALRSRVSQATLAQIAARLAGHPDAWLGLVRYDTCERWYRRLVHEEDHEVWLLSWLPGQGTGFHDHGASADALCIAVGRLIERSAAGGRPEPSGRNLDCGAVRSFGPDYVHDVTNESAQPAVSIHAYSPKLTSMLRYEVTDSGLLSASVEDRSW
jgi:predicted metal-dependent enzyme (double-stranded beta helix superfamily)